MLFLREEDKELVADAVEDEHKQWWWQDADDGAVGESRELCLRAFLTRG